MPSTLGLREEKAELEAVFASGIFSRAPGLAQMLNYVCTKYFDGQSDQVKEYNIAVEALGRSPDFDQKRDSIVRVEAHRLRKRLAEYYEGDGATHRVRIVLPSGQYVPQFITVEPQPVKTQPSTELVAMSPVVMTQPAMETVALAPPTMTETERPRFALATLLVAAAALVLVAAFLIFWVSLRPAVADGPAIAAPQGDEIRILAGETKATFTDQLGRTWQPDRFYTGGWETSATPGHLIEGTRDSALYQKYREGDFQYDIPVKPGVYELHLHFAETMYGEHNPGGGGETSRLFQVDANGKRILDYFDVISDAHGASVADERVFKDISPASDGQIHLQFTHRVRDAFVNAIEVLPGLPGRLRPIRIVMRSQPETDKRGDVWTPDRYYHGGQTILRAVPPSGTDDPELYGSERYGNLTYVIPVAPGSYSVTMKFHEAYFGAGAPVEGGIGERQFDIIANSQMLEHAFDIFKEAGGAERAVDRTFHDLHPNHQGKLIISLVPIANYACINAMEILDEAR